jgi:hypothetical protein
MTPKQKHIIKKLKEDIIVRDGCGKRHCKDYEYKEFSLEDLGGTIRLFSQVGLKNDEGTMASIYGRTTRHIFIRKGGGLELANAKDKNKSRGYFNVVYGTVK